MGAGTQLSVLIVINHSKHFIRYRVLFYKVLTLKSHLSFVRLDPYSQKNECGSTALVCITIFKNI